MKCTLTLQHLILTIGFAFATTVYAEAPYLATSPTQPSKSTNARAPKLDKNGKIKKQINEKKQLKTQSQKPVPVSPNSVSDSKHKSPPNNND